MIKGKINSIKNLFLLKKLYYSDEKNSMYTLIVAFYYCL
jgi:hypothetical protein